jgi:hypothetical protein
MSSIVCAEMGGPLMKLSIDVCWDVRVVIVLVAVILPLISGIDC